MSPLLRTALAAALVVVCGLLLTRFLVMQHRSVLTITSSDQPSEVKQSLLATQVALAGLESAACMSYPAASGRSKTVFIDAGHGGIDPGVVGSAGGRQLLEKDATLAVATRLSALLHADGYRVVMARTQDTAVTKVSGADSVLGSLTASAEHRDLLTRAACANAAGASVLISIHFDAFSDPSVGGTETFYDTARPFAADNKRLAADLQSALVAGLGTSDRGIWTDDQLAAPALTSSGNGYGHLIELGPAAQGWVDSPSQMPGALVEPLFLTNPAEARVAADPEGQQRMAKALEAGLQKYFSGA
jgi:N-acetylmuramoyl-L-alanine amidase